MGLTGRGNRERNQQGFTIIEFLIATAVFSVILLICSLAILHVGRMFYKGVITNRTQDIARKLSEDISDHIRFGVGSPNPSLFYGEAHTTSAVTFPSGATTHLRSVCIGTVRFTFSTSYDAASFPADGTTRMMPMGTGASQVNVGLWKDRRISSSSECTILNINDPAQLEESRNTLGGQELLSTNMRVSKFRINRAQTDGSLWAVDVRVSHGDADDLFTDGSDASVCVGAIAGGHFCAVSELTTYVTKRL